MFLIKKKYKIALLLFTLSVKSCVPWQTRIVCINLKMYLVCHLKLKWKYTMNAILPAD